MAVYKKVRILKTKEFDKWLKSLDQATALRVVSRLHKVELYGHLGHFKNLGGELYELKWQLGIRVYFVIAADEEGNLFIALFGGSKNGQQRDIEKARIILKRYKND